MTSIPKTTGGALSNDCYAEGRHPVHMELTQPIVFEPLFMERVWGGRRLETLLGKRLPPGERIGESWEIVDREAAQSVVHEGSLQGATLHELWMNHRDDIFGAGLPDSAIVMWLPLIMTVDWIIARARSVVNVLSDMLVAILLDRSALPEEGTPPESDCVEPELNPAGM